MAKKADFCSLLENNKPIIVLHFGTKIGPDLPGPEPVESYSGQYRSSKTWPSAKGAVSGKIAFGKFVSRTAIKRASA